MTIEKWQVGNKNENKKQKQGQPEETNSN